MSLYVSDCLLVDGNVCRQSLGKAAAAALYTEAVRQSVDQSQSLEVSQTLSDSRCRSVSGRVRLDLELDLEKQLLECWREHKRRLR